MRRVIARFVAFLIALTLAGSDAGYRLDPVTPRTIAVRAQLYALDGAILSTRLRFARGWILSSRDSDFGGLSGLAVTSAGLMALSDRGVIFTFAQDGKGNPTFASLRPLPHGCGDGTTKLQRDSESLARDPRTGDYWIGMEWLNALCHAGPDLRRGRFIQPAQMKRWPRTGGPEAMARLSDGRTIIIAERLAQGEGNVPFLVFDDDPDSSAPAVKRLYVTPAGYRPTDIAELPDGNLILVHRQFRLPLDFRTIVSIIPKSALDGEGAIRARPIALLRAPAISDNFEGVAVSHEKGRTYIWLVSDDNFVLTQKTYLLKFELLSGSGVR